MAATLPQSLAPPPILAQKHPMMNKLNICVGFDDRKCHVDKNQHKVRRILHLHLSAARAAEGLPVRNLL